MLQNDGASEQKTPNTQKGRWPGEDTVTALCGVKDEIKQETKWQCYEKRECCGLTSFLQVVHTAGCS